MITLCVCDALPGISMNCSLEMTTRFVFTALFGIQEVNRLGIADHSKTCIRTLTASSVDSYFQSSKPVRLGKRSRQHRQNSTLNTEKDSLVGETLDQNTPVCQYSAMLLFFSSWIIGTPKSAARRSRLWLTSSCSVLNWIPLRGIWHQAKDWMEERSRPRLTSTWFIIGSNVVFPIQTVSSRPPMDIWANK